MKKIILGLTVATLTIYGGLWMKASLDADRLISPIATLANRHIALATTGKIELDIPPQPLELITPDGKSNWEPNRCNSFLSPDQINRRDVCKSRMIVRRFEDGYTCRPSSVAVMHRLYVLPLLEAYVFTQGKDQGLAQVLRDVPDALSEKTISANAINQLDVAFLRSRRAQLMEVTSCKGFWVYRFKL